jgi:PAS domain S-box-containing protein
MRAPRILRRYPSRIALIVSCLAFIGLMWAGIIVMLHVDRAVVIESRQRENDNLTQVFAENITRTIRAAEITLSQMVSEYQLYGKAFDLAGYARMRGIYLDPATLLSIGDEEGNLVLASSPSPMPMNYRGNSNHQHHETHDTPDVFISEPRIGTTTQKWTIYLSRRINKADGSFGGTALYGLDPIYLAGIYREIDLGADSIFNLIGRDGVMRVRVGALNFSTGQDATRTLLFTKYLPATNHGGFIAKSPFDQVTRIYSYRALNNYPLIVLIGTSLPVALAAYEARKSLYTDVGGGLTVVVLGFGLFAVRLMAKDEQATERIHRSATMLAEAQKTARLGSWELDKVSNRLGWSDEVYRIFEIDRDRFGASYEAFLEAVHPEDRKAVNDAYIKSVADRVPYRMVHRLVMPDGRIKWVEERCNTSYDDAGRPLRSMGTVQDITELVLIERQVRQSLAEKETLLREIHHRVKNNLQTISSLLFFQSRKVKHPDDLAAFREANDRLGAMILVHENLYQSSQLSRVDFGGYVRTMVAQIAEAHMSHKRRIATRVETGDYALPVEIAQPCGLLLCELLINAFKHAFPDGGGTVAVHVTDAGGRMNMTVSDDGVGLPEGFDAKATRSFGWRLIGRLVTQINGTVSVAHINGTTVAVSFPLPAEVQ